MTPADGEGDEGTHSIKDHDQVVLTSTLLIAPSTRCCRPVAGEEKDCYLAL